LLRFRAPSRVRPQWHSTRSLAGYSCGNSRSRTAFPLRPRGAPPGATLACLCHNARLPDRVLRREDLPLIRYRVRLADLDRHLFEVECRIDQPAEEQRFTLPAWIPGSYLLRDFARHVVHVAARSGREAVRVEKIGAAEWVAHGA